MKTKILNDSGIKEAVQIIKNGGLVAFATETVYGLGADALNADAVKSIFIAKGRPQDNPLIVHIANLDMLIKIAREIPPIAYKLFEKFSPGPLTIVLKKSDLIPNEVSAGLDTVGIRMPKHKLALEFIKQCNTPIAAPSANASKRISPTTALHVYEDMQGKIPLILDGGNCSVGIESTVLSLCEDVPTILRPGAITPEMLLEVLSSVKTHKGEVKVASAPGMKYKHYAPVVPCLLASRPDSATNFSKQHPNSVVLGRTKFIDKVNATNKIDLGKDIIDMERNIFRTMRDAEKIYSHIIVELPEDDGVGYSVKNRLLKSSENNII